MKKSIFLVFLHCLTPVMTSQAYPSQICLPKQIQMKAYDLRSFSGKPDVVAIDYDRQLFGVHDSYGNHLVKDLKNSKVYDADPTGTCYYYDLNPTKVFTLPRCSPPDAGPMTDNATTIGNFLEASVPVQIWEYFYNNRQVRMLLVVTAEPGKAHYLVMWQVEHSDGSVPQPDYPPGYWTFFTEPTPYITDLDILKFPDPCPPYSVIG